MLPVTAPLPRKCRLMWRREGTVGGRTANPTRPIKQNSHAVCGAGRGDKDQKDGETSLLLHPSKPL